MTSILKAVFLPVSSLLPQNSFLNITDSLSITGDIEGLCVEWDEWGGAWSQKDYLEGNDPDKRMQVAVQANEQVK